ncbi:MAG: SGNH/GDSL hydrolase family protein [Kovacikia sp.]
MNSKRKFFKFVASILVSWVAVVFLEAGATPPIKIMPLGDSLTIGVDGGYRTKLYELLSKSRFSFNFVGTQSDGPANLPDKHHEGHGGFVIGPGASTLDQFTNGKGNLYVNIDTYLQQNPDIILMNIGWNEYFNVKLPNFQPDQEAPKRLTNLLDKIYQNKPNIAIFVASLTPAKWDPNLGKPFNQALPGIVQQQQAKGRKCFFVDMHSQAQFTNADYSDELHPSASGYAKMAQVWFSHLKPYLSNLTNPTPPPQNSGKESSKGGFSCSHLTALGNYLQNWAR